MLSRIIFSLTHAWQERLALRRYKTDPSRQCAQVIGLNAAQFKTLGAKVLVLDFDGVLSPHGAITPLPEVTTWLKQLVKQFPQKQIYILSNKPLPQRKAWFEEHFPLIHFVSGIRKKPYPDGLQHIIQASGARPSEVWLIDDRLFTGMLACILSGTRGIWVTQPYKDFGLHALPELFFTCLRTLEKAIV